MERFNLIYRTDTNMYNIQLIVSPSVFFIVDDSDSSFVKAGLKFKVILESSLHIFKILNKPDTLICLVKKLTPDTFFGV